MKTMSSIHFMYELIVKSRPAIHQISDHKLGTQRCIDVRYRSFNDNGIASKHSTNNESVEIQTDFI